MITGIIKSKIITKYISCKCKSEFDGRTYKSNQKWNHNKCWCKCKQISMWKRLYLESCYMCLEKYLLSIPDNLVITSDKIIEETKTIPTNFNEKNIIRETKSFCFTYLLFKLL